MTGMGGILGGIGFSETRDFQRDRTPVAPAGGVSLSKQTLGSSRHQALPEGTEESGSSGFRRVGWVGFGRDSHPSDGWDCPSCGNWPLTFSPDCEPSLWCARCGAPGPGSCPLCHGELVVPVGPPDEFGNVDFDDCDCVKP